MTESNKTENLPVEDRPLDDPILVRKAKRQAIFDAGDEPYRRRYDVDAHAAELAERLLFSFPHRYEGDLFHRHYHNV